jgi:hypothetical protein
VSSAERTFSLDEVGSLAWLEQTHGRLTKRERAFLLRGMFPEQGDFSVAGVRTLKSLAYEHGWSEQQTHEAGEAIASNLSRAGSLTGGSRCSSRSTGF